MAGAAETASAPPAGMIDDCCWADTAAADATNPSVIKAMEVSDTAVFVTQEDPSVYTKLNEPSPELNSASDAEPW